MEAEAEAGAAGVEDWKKIVPKGFHFLPTERELIVNFLQVKILGGTIPPGIIKDQDLYEFPPNELFIKNKAYVHKNGRMYFFTHVSKKSENGNGHTYKRLVAEGNRGFWRASQKGKDVKNYQGDAVIGIATPLVYYADKNTKTSWHMIELRLPSNQTKKMVKELTLCIVYHRETKRNEEEN